MITTIMAAFAFSYCVMDIVMSYHNYKETQKALKQLIEAEQ